MKKRAREGTEQRDMGVGVGEYVWVSRWGWVGVDGWWGCVGGATPTYPHSTVENEIGPSV